MGEIRERNLEGREPKLAEEHRTLIPHKEKNAE